LLDASKNFFLRHGNLSDLPSSLGGIDIAKTRMVRQSNRIVGERPLHYS